MDITVLIYDVETYQNFFMIGYSVATPILDDKGVPYKFEYKRYYVSTDNLKQLKGFLERVYTLKDKIVMVGYNNTHYDKALLEECYRIRNKTKEEILSRLYELSNSIVTGKDSSFRYNDIPQYDLMSINHSLKSIGAIIHQDNILELPYSPDRNLSDKEKEEIINYNQNNDLDITEKILNLKFDTFMTQYDTIKEFNLPMSSFSSSASGLSELVLGDPLRQPPRQFRTTYKCPYKFNFIDKTLQDIKYEMENTVYVIGEGEGFKKTFEYKGLEITVGEGGIHACIPNYKGKNVIDVDVASYYPSMIINLDTLPTSKEKKELYKFMKKDRVINKRKGLKGKANAQKLILNSAFGKTKFYSKDAKGNIKKLGKMFDFKSFMTTTLTGQLLLLKLMEDLDLAGYKTVYMNTDGLSFEPNGKDDWKEVCKKWEELAEVELEDTIIEKSYVRDVNNYIMVVNDGGKIKRKIKGCYVTDPVSNGSFTSNSAKRRICYDAVVKYVLDGIEIEDTINNSNDIRDFIIHHKFSGKFYDAKLFDKDNNELETLGKIPRWYKSKTSRDYLGSINKELKRPLCPFASDNITIINKLSDYDNGLPSDLDKDWYIQEAYRIYKELTNEDLKGNNRVKSMLEELKERGII